MQIRTPAPWSLPEREATPESLYLNRRQWLAGAIAAGLVPALGGPAAAQVKGRDLKPDDLAPLSSKPGGFGTSEKLTPFEAVTRYNNFYEFGLDKDDPAREAWRLRPSHWTVRVDGLVKQPRTLDVDTLIKASALEERVYRLRCVEGWSMVIPWVGIPLADVVRALEPQGGAKFIAFQTLNDRRQMPGLSVPVIDWPYREGLRMDEAMNPLSMLVVGLYGRRLPNQNGAPIRLVVPWKYGFKSIKSIVGLRFTESQPTTSWQSQAPHEYGFFANVNPNVDHPRWSQGKERRIGELLRRDTLMFNGYAEQVAHLYKGMDLTRFY
jgi:methionine sulfoxide reductase catalytic subunit